MKVVEVTSSNHYLSQIGLKPISMKRLGKVVILTGKNGSGKTRILNYLRSQLPNSLPTPERIELENRIKAETSKIENWANQKKEYESKKNLSPEQLSDISLIQRNINQILTVKNTLEHNLRERTQVKIESEFVAQSIYFVPRDLSLQNPESFNKQQLQICLQNIQSPGIESLGQSTLGAIQFIQDQWREATHQDQLFEQNIRNNAIKEYERLQSLIKEIFNTKIERDVNGNALMFGKKLGQAGLSDGQIVLLQLCLAIYGQTDSIKNYIIIMDEPENHLHPAALIEVVDRIANILTDGQLWISTHSINLIAHYGTENLWYIEDGEVSYAGRKPERVLEGLLGTELELSLLRDFLGLPEQYASTRFAFECLFPPAVVETTASDPQSHQIREVILNMAISKDIKILDFGAGKGRTISNMVDYDPAFRSEIVAKVNYIAFDESSENRNSCIKAIEDIYGTSTNRYFNKLEELLIQHDNNSFDIVLMCNVLHEIPTDDWVDIFSESIKGIDILLKPDGYLLIVEDQFIAIGELAHPKGFLMLNTLELKKLFQIPSSETRFKIHQKKDGRLKAHLVPKEYLANICQASMNEAFNALASTARSEIKRLRTKVKKDYNDGRLHGFWVQQLANAEFAVKK